MCPRPQPKLTTGVTIRPWTGILMLRNSSSPETYFQAAFRVQSPWTVRNPDSTSPNKEEIIKEECYIFDFAPDGRDPNRCLRAAPNLRRPFGAVRHLYPPKPECESAHAHQHQ